MSNPDPENSDGFDVPDEGLWEERFRDALTKGDELLIAKVLRLAESLGPSTIETLALLFEGGVEHRNGFEKLYEFQLLLVGRKRGRQKDPSKRWFRDPEISAWVNERLSKKELRKNVISDATMKFGLSRSTVEKILAENQYVKSIEDGDGI